MDNSKRYGTAGRDENPSGWSVEAPVLQGTLAPELQGSLLFQKKRTWKINEYDLNQGLAALCKKDPSAKGRVEKGTLTRRDVEYIIEKASFGIIKLELSDYEY